MFAVLFVVLVVVYELGILAALLVLAVRAGGSPLGPYITAVMHPPSRRNGIPWLVRSFGKALAWPLVLYNWDREGRPPSPVLFGGAAAERLGMASDSAQGMATKWTAPAVTGPRTSPPTRPASSRPASPQRDPRDAVLRELAIMREEIRRNDIEDTGLMNRPRYNKAVSKLTAMGAAAVPTLLEYLDHLSDDDHDSPDHWAAVFIVEVLGKIGDPSSVPRLQALLAQPYGPVGLALGQMKDPAGVQALLDALHDEDDFVRKQAAAGLGVSSVLPGKVAGALVQGLSDSSANVREAAACSLGSVGHPHPKILDALRAVARDDQVEWVRQMAERSLRQLISA